MVKGMLIFWGLLLGSLLVRAEEFSPAFRDSFLTFSRMRQLEDRAAGLRDRKDLEEEERRLHLDQLKAELTAARIDFHAAARDKTLSPWERKILNRASHVSSPALDPTALQFLTETYLPSAKTWSPAEWQYAGEWFGKGTEDAFFRLVFSVEKLPPESPNPASEAVLVWIQDPFEKLLPKDELSHRKAERNAASARLQRLGISVEELGLEMYSRIDDQAEAVHLALTSRLEKGPVILLSSDHGSAVLLRALDLNPGLLGHSGIRGWINLNGKLFGDEALTSRSPASLTKADQQLADAKREFHILRDERFSRQAPMSTKFPVLNLLSAGGPRRPGVHLRDSILPEAKTMFIEAGDVPAALGAALPALIQSYAKPELKD